MQLNMLFHDFVSVLATLYTCNSNLLVADGEGVLVVGVIEFVVIVHVCETIVGQEAANLKKTFWVSPFLCKK